MPAREPVDDQVERLRAGDEGAFRELIAAHHGAMLRFARSFVRNPATAEEVVQDTWMHVVQGLDRFEGRSSLASWMFSILANRARTRAVRDGRTIVFSDMAAPDGDDDDVDPSRFNASGYWHEPPRPWDDLTPERLAASAQARELLLGAIDELPEGQRAVAVLRDLEGLSAEEACNILGLSETNQRVLLHRGRSRLRRQLETLVGKGKG